MGKTAGQFCQHVHEWETIVKPAANGIVASAMQGDTLNGTSGTRKPTSSGLCPCGAWLGSLGLEPTPELYIEHLVECFRHVRRALRDDGVLWLNLGDSYAGSGKGPSNSLNRSNPHSHEAAVTMKRGLNNLRDTPTTWMPLQRVGPQEHTIGIGRVHGYKPKDLMLMPFRVAMALQTDGWTLRAHLPWLKRNCMPGSEKDRPTVSVESVFLFSKKRRYFWDHNAVHRTDKGLDHRRTTLVHRSHRAAFYLRIKGFVFRMVATDPDATGARVTSSLTRGRDAHGGRRWRSSGTGCESCADIQ
jgi:hypothetical protein